MKRLLATFLLLASLAGAQSIKPASGGLKGSSLSANCIPKAVTAATLNCSSVVDNGTNVTGTLPFVSPNGTATAPGFGVGGSNTGFYRASTEIGITMQGSTAYVAFTTNNSGGVTIFNGGGLFWNSAADAIGGSRDLSLKRRGAANLQLGFADVNGTPVAQTLSVQNAITGTDLPGKQFSLAGSLGTGAALPLPVVIQGADASVASGGTAQTEINRLICCDAKNLTTGAATTLLSIPLATLQTTGGLVFIHMEATDGTNQCTLDDLVTYSAENSAGVFVNQTSKMGTGSTACTAAKTLTATYAFTSANPALLQVTPTLTGITATRFTAVYTVMHGGMTNPTL